MKLDSEQIMACLAETDNSTSQMESILNEVVLECTKTLDDVMLKIKQEVVDVEDAPQSIIEKYFIQLSNEMYFVGANIERFSLHDSISKATYKEAFNNSYLNNLVGEDGKKRTAAELTSISEENAKYEGVVNDMYNKAYRMIKFKVDAAQVMISTLSKILSLRLNDQQSGLRVEKVNNRQILNEEGAYFS